jgi:hypothetical protein
MKNLAIVLAVGAAALLGGSAANASDNAVKAKAATGVTQSSTDISSRGRHWRGHRYMTYRHYRPYGYAQPYYGSYGYAPQPYYYGGGGPIVSFGFGGGGWGHRGGGWGHRGW